VGVDVYPAGHLPLAAERVEVRQHRARADARAALGPKRQLALGEGGAGDVEVRPRQAAPQKIEHWRHWKLRTLATNAVVVEKESGGTSDSPSRASIMT